VQKKRTQVAAVTTQHTAINRPAHLRRGEGKRKNEGKKKTKEKQKNNNKKKKKKKKIINKKFFDDVIIINKTWVRNRVMSLRGSAFRRGAGFTSTKIEGDEVEGVEDEEGEEDEEEEEEEEEEPTADVDGGPPAVMVESMLSMEEE
jgi:hypothetical protein